MPHPKTVAPAEIHAAIGRVAAAIAARHTGERLLLLGIANGGIVFAQRLAALLSVRAGVLDISFHRDDIGRHPIPKEFTPTLVPGDIQGAGVVLVDDVLFTGRTVKAALDELFDPGRPAWVELAVLVDRGGRRLPVSADFVGLRLAADDREKIIVTLDKEAPKRDKITVTSSK
jgi:pyrimidine operon attenuation protein / uracil phosphoribosyltransferase